MVTVESRHVRHMVAYQRVISCFSARRGIIVAGNNEKYLCEHRRHFPVEMSIACLATTPARSITSFFKEAGNLGGQ